jgi:hypothetical protein
MISAFHYENDPDDMEASMLDQYTAIEMLTPTEKFKKYVERSPRVKIIVIQREKYKKSCWFFC